MLWSILSYLSVPPWLALVALLGAYLVFCMCGSPKSKGAGKGDLKQQRRYEGGADASASACWARNDGRFKHCGLRDDPFDPAAPPPRYSLEKLDLPVPKLSSTEQNALDELISNVEDLASRGARTDPGALLPFLRARRGDVQAAEVYVRQSWNYKEEMDIHGMDTRWDLEVYERCFAPWYTRGGIIGHGLKGEIVGLERFGRSHLPELLAALPFELLQKLDAVHMVRTLAAFEEDAMRRRRWFGDSILILDLDGLDWNCCTPQACHGYAKLVYYRNLLLPSSLGQAFVIRAPKTFSIAWGVFKHLLDPVTRSKVQIVSSPAASLALLRQHVSNDVIPGYLGGRGQSQGDLQCRLLLGSSSEGPPPQEAIDRLLALAASSAARSPSGKGDEIKGELVGKVEPTGKAAKVELDGNERVEYECGGCCSRRAAS